MRAARTDDDRKRKIRRRCLAREVLDRATSDNCARVTPAVAGISSPSIPESRPCSLSRSRLQTNCGGLSSGRGQRGAAAIDHAQRIAAFLGVRRDHDRNVMVGQRRRQFCSGDHVERQQFDSGILQQELDRRIAAHVDRGRQRQHAQLRLFRRTGRTKQLMKAEHFRLDRKPASVCRPTAARSATDRAPRPRRRCRRQPSTSIRAAGSEDRRRRRPWS